MELGSAAREDDRAVDRALLAGLRSIATRRLPAYAPGHTAQGRLWFVATLALTVSDALEVVAIAPTVVARVARLLAAPSGDVALESLRRWVDHGGLAS